ncbi:CDP-glucose 4,6-dehydratase [Thiorhodococcus minor]|uniref:CDP-glucose 4,6-dehydratase n=1 Tax=Thiorhodococcus minor TaxID=57489 RepID=A0A6M0JSN7_9GAMM|nr:CDP-glucose 4,6-dehydratase [Thiorhodococcus minor]
MSRGFWRDRRVLVTGHTGFKGGWLALWLSEMGAQVFGYAQDPPTDPNLFTLVGLAERLAEHRLGDIRDYEALAVAVAEARPEIVFHLAAQPLVREAYRSPLETYAVNIMGTANLLETLRHTPTARAVVVVTSDKCYESREWVWPYREIDPLGGDDPYASSKGCAELVTSAYRRSFLAAAGIQVATARAGNVIGGGDWASDRLLPDVLRALDRGQTVPIRSPLAVRPWQHVLEPLSGYLALGERLHECGDDYAQSWNFGPDAGDVRSVGWILEHLSAQADGLRWRLDDDPQPHETSLLALDSAKAIGRLGWRPRWDLGQALDRTLDWHRAWRDGADMRRVSLQQIDCYATERAGL